MQYHLNKLCHAASVKTRGSMASKMAMREVMTGEPAVKIGVRFL